MTIPVERVLQAYPLTFFQQVLESADAGFGEALTLAKRHVEEQERANMLGQLRHARCEAGFRRAASEAGLTVHASHTDPPGGRYSLIVANGVYLIRSNIQCHCGTPRPTAFRKAWSALNRWLTPYQLDLLQPVDPPPADRLCGIIVITANPRWGDSSVPSFVGLGIPRADLSNWVMLMSLSDLLARYHDAVAQTNAPRDVVIDIKDKAVPRLKRQRDS